LVVTAPVGLAGIEHIVVLMLENRSFDHMLGYLYSENGNVSPRGDAFDGLSGRESCPDATGNPVSVYRITPDTPHTYLMPGADPGEGFAATNAQLFGAETPAPGAKETNQGFVRNYAKAIAANRAKHWYVVPGTTPEMIMGCYAPETLPVLSALARGYAVCDHWFCSAPTMTMPNRAFACAGTSQGHLDDHTKIFTVPSIFGSMSDHSVPWKIYGYDKSPLTRLDFPDTTGAASTHFGLFTDFRADAAVNTVFLCRRALVRCNRLCQFIGADSACCDGCLHLWKFGCAIGLRREDVRLHVRGRADLHHLRIDRHRCEHMELVSHGNSLRRFERQIQREAHCYVISYR